VTLPIPYPIEPMEAETVDNLPTGPQWPYEPKWDGFRAIAFRDGDELLIQSRNGKPLGRYFPELVRALVALGRATGETAEAAPTGVVKEAGESASFQLSPATTRRDQAAAWLGMTGSGLDGIVAKRLDQAYQPGRRAMQKYKRWQTVDCVVGGVYLGSDGQSVESVLLGLYDDDGKLHYVGHSTVRADARGGLPAARTVGADENARSSRCAPSWSSKPVPITSRTAISATGRVSCAGAPTRTPATAPWIRSSGVESPVRGAIPRRAHPVGERSRKGRG
jgi:ATP dependent DNA ligase domain